VISPYSYIGTKDSSVNTSPGGYAINVSKNHVMRTKDLGLFSDRGEGWMFSPVGFVNPTVSKNNLSPVAILLGDSINGARVAGNYSLGLSHCVYLLATDSSGRADAFNDILISDNIGKDCFQGFSHSLTGGPTKYRWGIKFSGNVWDCDPYFLSADRNGFSGGWNSVDVTSATAGLNVRNLDNVSVSGDTFRNCYIPMITNTPGSAGRFCRISDCIVECYPVAVGYSASNEGVGYIPSGAEMTILPVYSDPTDEANYLEIHTPVYTSYVSRPSSGIYVEGHFVRDTTGVDQGWRRLTTGSGHVLGTDWAVV